MSNPHTVKTSSKVGVNSRHALKNVWVIRVQMTNEASKGAYVFVDNKGALSFLCDLSSQIFFLVQGSSWLEIVSVRGVHRLKSNYFWQEPNQSNIDQFLNFTIQSNLIKSSNPIQSNPRVIGLDWLFESVLDWIS